MKSEMDRQKKLEGCFFHDGKSRKVSPQSSKIE
jgi:hypothetical protein